MREKNGVWYSLLGVVMIFQWQHLPDKMIMINSGNCSWLHRANWCVVHQENDSVPTTYTTKWYPNTMPHPWAFPVTNHKNQVVSFIFFYPTTEDSVGIFCSLKRGW